MPPGDDHDDVTGLDCGSFIEIFGFDRLPLALGYAEDDAISKKTIQWNLPDTSTACDEVEWCVHVG